MNTSNTGFQQNKNENKNIDYLVIITRLVLLVIILGTAFWYFDGKSKVANFGTSLFPKLGQYLSDDYIITDSISTVWRNESDQTLHLYDGSAVEGKPTGTGCYILAKNKIVSDLYQGQYFDGMKHGRGKYITSLRDGSVESIYEGGWKNDKEDGKGTYYLYRSNGTVKFIYKGTYRNGKRYGQGAGTLYDENEKLLEKYSGPWKDGEPLR